MSSAAGEPLAKEKPRRQHHLYLVFDDWCRGYSIRKVSLSPSPGRHQQPAAVSSGQEDEAKSEVPPPPVRRRLPPPLIRMVAPRSSPNYFVAAFGSRILAMHPPGDSMAEGDDGSSESYFPMFGVRSRSITFGPWKQRREHPWMTDAPIYLPVGKKLFTLSTESFEMLGLDHIIYPQVSYCSMDRNLNWSWKQLPRQPFEVDDVASYTLHPRKRTFLVSTKPDAAAAPATFAFDTKALSWKLLGNWALPFAGRGHFVPHLKAFVGLSKDPGTLGQLRSCDVPSFDAGDGRCPAPSSRVCNEKLFTDNPAERHVSATLVDMGCDGEFCLVECVSIADQALIEEGDARLPGRCFYRVATFFLTYDMNGDLMTGKSRQVQCYEVPEATSKLFLAEDPVAFWMQKPKFMS